MEVIPELKEQLQSHNPLATKVENPQKPQEPEPPKENPLADPAYRPLKPGGITTHRLN